MSAVTQLHDPKNGLAMSTTDRRLGWWGVFPPIVREGSRWWLPLSDTATIAVGRAIVASRQGDEPNPIEVRSLLSGFRSDPPLLIYAACHWPGEEMITAEELAEWFMVSAADHFAGGDWLLAAPKIEEEHQRHWSRLMAATQRQHPSTWLNRAADWMRILGASVDFESSLPTLIWDDQPASNDGLRGSKLLQQMARARKRELVVTSSLSKLADKRKLAAAKQLAYGLSHEINNPLANISARAQQLKHGETDASRLASLDRVIEQVYRAHEMIAGLMFFAHPPEPEFSRIDLNAVVVEAVDDFRESAAQCDVRLLVESKQAEAYALADRAMMVEAIRALIRNAMEAVDHGGTVVVSLEAEDESGGDEFWSVHIADSGPGLDADASQHAFDPFYSGREAGRGLGLGLCRAYRVAKLHNATVHLSGGLAGCVSTIRLLRSE